MAGHAPDNIIYEGKRYISAKAAAEMMKMSIFGIKLAAREKRLTGVKLANRWYFAPADVKQCFVKASQAVRPRKTAKKGARKYDDLLAI